MTDAEIKKRARQLLAPYDDDGWVIIENAIEVWAAAMREAAAQARLESLMTYKGLAQEFCYQMCDEKWGENINEHLPPCQYAQKCIAELEAAMKSTKP